MGKGQVQQQPQPQQRTNKAVSATWAVQQQQQLPTHSALNAHNATQLQINEDFFIRQQIKEEDTIRQQINDLTSRLSSKLEAVPAIEPIGELKVDEVDRDTLDQTIDALTNVKTNTMAAIAEVNVLSEKLIKDTTDAINSNITDASEIISQKIIGEFKQIMDKSYADVVKLVQSIPSQSDSSLMQKHMDFAKLPAGIYICKYQTLLDRLNDPQNHPSNKRDGYAINIENIHYPWGFPQHWHFEINKEKISEALRQRVMLVVEINRIFGYYPRRNNDPCNQMWILSNGCAIIFGILQESDRIVSPYNILPDITNRNNPINGALYYIKSMQLDWLPLFIDNASGEHIVMGYYTGPLDKIKDISLYSTISKIASPIQLGVSYLQSELPALNQLPQITGNIESLQKKVLEREKQLETKIAELNKTVAEKNQQIMITNRLNSTVAGREDAIQEKNKLLQERNELLQVEAERLQSLDKELSDRAKNLANEEARIKKSTKHLSQLMQKMQTFVELDEPNTADMGALILESRALMATLNEAMASVVILK